jgi:dihydrofolate reductase
MGKACYDQNMHADFKDKKVYVATNSDLADHDNVHFIRGDISNVILKERDKEGKHIFLFGGGILINSFLKSDIIDEFIIGVIPIILGKGRPLFYENIPTTKLKLEEYIIDEGVVILRYTRNDR